MYSAHQGRLWFGAGLGCVLLCVAVVSALRWLNRDPSAPASSPDGPARNRTSSISGAANGLNSGPYSDQPTNALFITPDIRWNGPIHEDTFARFRDWAERYRATRSARVRATLAKEGLTLARQRREELAALIESNPERALALTVPVIAREAVPRSVAEQLEVRVSGRGNLDVLAALPEAGQEARVVPTFRTATLGGAEFKAFVYGRRLGEPTRTAIPLNGIAIGNRLAVDENPLRVMEPAETARARANAADPVCAVSGLPSAAKEDKIAADVGGRVIFLCRRSHAEELNARLIAAEFGPDASDGTVRSPKTSQWTQGEKRLILIRVDFTDLPGAPFSESAGTNLVNGLGSFYSEMSYGRTGYSMAGAGSDVTPNFRMPQPGAWYGTNDYYAQLRADARNAAAAAGYVLDHYDHDLICFGPVPGWGWSGMGYIGAAGAWLRGTSAIGIAAHELGHNYGLNHASFWETYGQSVLGAGTSVEYGDDFDTMATATAGRSHFNVRNKSYLEWLRPEETLTVTSNGIYRIYAQDDPAATGLRGLRIVKNSYTNYWVEFRQQFTANKWLMNGAGLRWAQNGNENSLLLDTTPGSTDGKNDSAIVIGRTFSDLQAGIYITPVGKGNTAPESLDVAVNLGAFPLNRPPTLTVAADATNAAPGVALNFSVGAADADGDRLAYYWDFGDGNFGGNSPLASKSWSAAGDYVVRCIVTDMKGGQASDSVLVTIGSPTTFRISGRITRNGFPLEGARVYVSPTRLTYTDSDGSYTLVGLPAGSYPVKASLEHFLFANGGFTSPISVGPNAAEINFLANYSDLLSPILTTQPLSQVVNPGATVTFSAAAMGTAPLAFQWRCNGVDLFGATASSYTKSNVQASDAGAYSVVVSNPVESVASVEAVLKVNSPPGITGPPQDLTVIAGRDAKFTVTASGTALLHYQWRFNGTNIAGAMASTFTRTNAQIADRGDYSVVITNSLGSVTSAPAALSINFELAANATYGGTAARDPDRPSYPPDTVVTLTARPVSVFPFTGWSGDESGTNNPLSVAMTTNLSVTANFTSPVPDLIVDNPAAIFAGNWATNTAGADKYGGDYRTAPTTQGAATATATFGPEIASAGRYDIYVWFPSVTKGAPNALFTVFDTGGTFAVPVNESGGSGGWRLLAAGRDFAQGTSGFVRLSNDAGAGGKSVVADAVRWVYSEAQPSPTPPLILASPKDRRVLLGGDASFGVAASGSGPLYYQWRFETSDIPGATNAFLSLTNVQLADAGCYLVAVNNAAGSATSAPASLVIISRPLIRPVPAALANTVRLVVVGTPGDVYTVEKSMNLIDWDPVTTLSNETGSVEFVEPMTADFTERFYRFKVVP